MCAFFCHEVAGYCHFVSFRYVFFQYRVVLNSSWNHVVAARYHFIAIFELNVHDDFFIDFLNRNSQGTIFHCHKISGYCHLVSFRYVLFQYGVVLYSFWYKVVAACYHFIAILELDIHDHIFLDLLDVDFQLSAIFCIEVTRHCHLISFRYKAFQYRVILNSCRNHVIAARDHFVPTFKHDVHPYIFLDLFDADFQFAAVFCIEITGYCHFISFRHILFQYRVVLHSFRYCVVAACYYFVAILELDIHCDIFLDFFYSYIQRFSFCYHKVSRCCHLISFRYILF